MAAFFSHLLGRAPSPGLLDGIGPERVVAQPFPHLVLENALPAETYATLERHFPEESRVRAGKHVANRDQLMAHDILRERSLHPAWMSFVQHHVSSAFYRDLLRVFRPWVDRLYPWLEDDLGKRLEDCTVGVRDPQSGRSFDVCLDCQPGLNAVTLDPATPRTAHLDAPNKLFTGLLYMRMPGDESRGGDFLIYRPRAASLHFDTPTTAAEADLDVAVTVPYRANTAVFFLNSPLSLHGVSIREGTPVPRRLVNLVAGCYGLPRKEFFSCPPDAAALAAAAARIHST